MAHQSQASLRLSPGTDTHTRILVSSSASSSSTTSMSAGTTSILPCLSRRIPLYALLVVLVLLFVVNYVAVQPSRDRLQRPSTNYILDDKRAASILHKSTLLSSSSSSSSNSRSSSDSSASSSSQSDESSPNYDSASSIMDDEQQVAAGTVAAFTIVNPKTEKETSLNIDGTTKKDDQQWHHAEATASVADGDPLDNSRFMNHLAEAPVAIHLTPNMTDAARQWLIYYRCEGLRKYWNIQPIGHQKRMRAIGGTRVAQFLMEGTPTEVKEEWTNLVCDTAYSVEPPTKEALAQPFGGRAQAELLVDHDISWAKLEKADTTWIAMLTPMTSLYSYKPYQNADDLPFWRLLFPSFLSTVRDTLLDDTMPFVYTFYIGFDSGDLLFEQQSERDRIIAKFESMLAATGLPAANLARVGFRLYRLGDTLHAPSWAVSHLAQMAVDTPAHYLYQINDDVEMLNNTWAQALTSVLREHSNFGVTGPADVMMRRILTQSFVHRTHMDIFGIYFAAPFKNWYSDDWLSQVYGSSATWRSHDICVRHVSQIQGQRYRVHASKIRLHSEVQYGRIKITQYLKEHNMLHLLPNHAQRLPTKRSIPILRRQ